jgi:hypothetical protein
MSNTVSPNAERILGHAARDAASVLLHLIERADGSIRLTVLYDPPRDHSETHVPTDIEAIADKLVRAAIGAGAREA